MLHGYGGSSYTWRHWVEPLARRGRVLLVDLKGFGEAPKPDDDEYGPQVFAELIRELLRRLDLSGVTLVGHSLGGGVALLTALRMEQSDREVIRRLVLVGAAAYRQRLPPFALLARAPRVSSIALRAAGPRRVVRAVLRSIVFDKQSITGEQVAAYTRPLVSRGGVRAALMTGRNVLPDDVDEMPARFAELDVPTLLLWGDHDRVVPLWVAERLATDLPDTRLVVLTDCGHLPAEERPDESWAAVAAFLDDTGGGR